MNSEAELNNINIANRIFGLDIFRSIAILLVVLVHGGFLLKGTSMDGFPYFRMIDGVDMFFVLSGFLIGGILLKAINLQEEFGITQLGTFWKRRWLRTLPNYYLILLANYIIIHTQIIHEDITQFNWTFFLFLQNLSSPFYGFFWESWSLSVEEWFYIFSPLLLIVLLKYYSPKKSFLIVTISLILLPFLCRVFSQDPSIDGFWFDVRFRKVVIMRLDSIAYGLLASWLFYYFQNYWQKYRLISLMIGTGLIYFVLNYNSEGNIFYQQVLSFSLNPISAVFFLPFAESIKKGKGVITKVITHISKISYSMYLLNLALVAEVIRDNFPPTSGTDGIIKYLLYWIIVLTGATLLYTYFERPIMNLRDRK